MECKRTSRAFCQCRIVNKPINHYLFSGETHSIGFANRGSCNDSANRNATNQWNSEVQAKNNTRVAQDNQRKAEEQARIEAERKRQELINQEIQRQNAEKQRQLEQQQAINEQNAIRESELLRQNEEQNIRVSDISKEAIKGTQDFATSQGQNYLCLHRMQLEPLQKLLIKRLKPLHKVPTKVLILPTKIWLKILFFWLLLGVRDF